MKLKIAVLPGDGIGPEIMAQGVKVMDAVAEKFGHQRIRKLYVAPTPSTRLEIHSLKRRFRHVKMPMQYFSPQ